MKKIKSFILLILLVLLQSGCKNVPVGDVNTIQIDKDDTIVSTIVEDFDKEYYIEEELKQEIEKAVEAYNAASGNDKARIDNFKVSNKKVRLMLRFATDQDYSAFNNVELFAGTVEEAVLAGYDFNSAFTKIEKGKVVEGDKIPGSEILELTDYKVIILEEATFIQVPGNIAYISEDVTIQGKKLAEYAVNATVHDEVQDTASGSDVKDTDTADSEELTETKVKAADEKANKAESGLAYIIYK